MKCKKVNKRGCLLISVCLYMQEQKHVEESSGREVKKVSFSVIILFIHYLTDWICAADERLSLHFLVSVTHLIIYEAPKHRFVSQWALHFLWFVFLEEGCTVYQLHVFLHLSLNYCLSSLLSLSEKSIKCPENHSSHYKISGGPSLKPGLGGGLDHGAQPGAAMQLHIARLIQHRQKIKTKIDNNRSNYNNKTIKLTPGMKII